VSFDVMRYLMFGGIAYYFGGGGSPSQTAQQVALQTEQGITNANLNLEENEQRKTILNALQGTRVFRGSALSRNIAGNEQDFGGAPVGAPSASQQAPNRVAVGNSLIDPQTGQQVGGGQPAGSAAATVSASGSAARTGVPPSRGIAAPGRL